MFSLIVKEVIVLLRMLQKQHVLDKSARRDLPPAPFSTSLLLFCARNQTKLNHARIETPKHE